MGKQALNFFNDYLFGIFAAATDAKDKLLEGDKITTTDVYLVTSAALSASDVVLTRGSEDYTFTDGTAGTMKAFVLKESFAMQNWVLTINDTTAKIPELWLVVRYFME